MATKRNYPNDYFCWYNDDDRLAILERVTSSNSTETHSEPWDSFQSAGDLSGDITGFADYNGTVAGTTKILSTAHGLYSGDRISITTSPDADYNGNFEITKIDADYFYISQSYIAETSGTWTSLFVDNGLKVSGNTRYAHTDDVTDSLKASLGLDVGLHHYLVCYVKARLLEDIGQLQQAMYYRKMFEDGMKKFPHRKSGIRRLSVPRLP